jgi:hypothetical protein
MLCFVRRITAIVVACWLVALGSGALAALHDLQHDREDAAIAAADRAAGRPERDAPHHDESNCPLHAQLHLPFIASRWVPILFCLGLFVAFLTPPPVPLLVRRAPQRLDCRGPPSCC